MSKATNPKDSVGAMKPDLSLIPPSALIELSLALMYGNVKYETKFNWRSNNSKIGICTYLAAGMRHKQLFLDGEDISQDGLINHLAHEMACNAIIIDAMTNGYAIDDRPVKGNASEYMEQACKRLKEQLLPAWKEERRKMLEAKNNESK